MKTSLKFKLIIAAIVIVLILAACGVASALSYGAMVACVASYLIGGAFGAYAYKIYKQLKDAKASKEAVVE